MVNRDDLPAPVQGLALTHFLTVRDVAVSRDFYADATAKGARFLTEPLDRKAELRCYLATPTDT